MLQDLLPRTRVHRIALAAGPDRQVWLKREDETGHVLAGGKKRKYASLIPWLRENGYDKVAVVGGENSNHLPAACQLLLEHGFEVFPVVFPAHFAPETGNAYLLNLLVPRHAWTWMDHPEWPSILPQDAFLLPEGAWCAPALQGAMTLADDILRNQQESGVVFDHIFVDAGTGLTALAMHFGLRQAGSNAAVCIVSMAEEEEKFKERKKDVMNWMGLEGDALADFRFLRPATAPSFGSLNGTVREAVLRYARNFGVLTDPVYTAKLLLTAEQLIAEENLMGNILVIHSGGTATLHGYADRFGG